MTNHKIRFDDGTVFEITDSELTKSMGSGVLIPYDEIEKSMKSKRG